MSPIPLYILSILICSKLLRFKYNLFKFKIKKDYLVPEKFRKFCCCLINKCIHNFLLIRKCTWKTSEAYYRVKRFEVFMYSLKPKPQVVLNFIINPYIDLSYLKSLKLKAVFWDWVKFFYPFYQFFFFFAADKTSQSWIINYIVFYNNMFHNTEFAIKLIGRVMRMEC